MVVFEFVFVKCWNWYWYVLFFVVCICEVEIDKFDVFVFYELYDVGDGFIYNFFFWLNNFGGLGIVLFIELIGVLFLV